MSAFDVVIQKYVTNTIYVLIVSLTICYIIKKLFIRYRDRLFAKFESAFAEVYNGPSKITKQNLFAPLHTLVSSDWKLKNNGLIRILEIGCGNGANLKYFPKNSHLVMVDRNAFYEPLLHDKLREYPSLHLERLVHCSAENMSEVPDGSIDAVVSTLVLCSVSNVKQVLSEVKRVLAPGGKFFFLEHVLAKNGTTTNTVQRFLSASKIWPTINCGCHLDRETGKAIKQAGFESIDMEEVDVYTESYIVFKLIRDHVAGVATK